MDLDLVTGDLGAFALQLRQRVGQPGEPVLLDEAAAGADEVVVRVGCAGAVALSAARGKQCTNPAPANLCKER